MKKDCTGPRYDTEHFTLSQVNGWHGKFGHLNVKELDHESACTGFGKHDRIVAFCPNGDTLECRVDHVWELGEPSPAQVLKHAKHRNGSYQRGKWVFDRKETWPCGKSTDYYFKRA